MVDGRPARLRPSARSKIDNDRVRVGWRFVRDAATGWRRHELGFGDMALKDSGSG